MELPDVTPQGEKRTRIASGTALKRYVRSIFAGSQGNMSAIICTDKKGYVISSRLFSTDSDRDVCSKSLPNDAQVVYLASYHQGGDLVPTEMDMHNMELLALCTPESCSFGGLLVLDETQVV